VAELDAAELARDCGIVISWGGLRADGDWFVL